MITIGDNVSIGANTIITSHNAITIGRDTKIASWCVIIDHDHNWDNQGIVDGFSVAATEIGDNNWIGANTIILKGTTIGNNSIVGPGTILKGIIPSCCKVVRKES